MSIWNELRHVQTAAFMQVWILIDFSSTSNVLHARRTGSNENSISLNFAFQTKRTFCDHIKCARIGANACKPFWIIELNLFWLAFWFEGGHEDEPIPSIMNENQREPCVVKRFYGKDSLHCLSAFASSNYTMKSTGNRIIHGQTYSFCSISNPLSVIIHDISAVQGPLFASWLYRLIHCSISIHFRCSNRLLASRLSGENKMVGLLEITLSTV